MPLHNLINSCVFVPKVFKRAFIPRKLEEVIDFERDIEKVACGYTEDILYPTITGLKSDLSGAQEAS